MADRSPPGAESGSNQARRVQEACHAFLVAHAALAALHGEGEEADPSALARALCRRDEALQRVRGQAARTKQAVRAKLRVLRTLQGWLGAEDDVVGRFAVEMTEEMAPFFAGGAAGGGIDEAARCQTPDERATWLHRLAPFLWFAVGPKQF